MGTKLSLSLKGVIFTLQQHIIDVKRVSPFSNWGLCVRSDSHKT